VEPGFYLLRHPGIQKSKAILRGKSFTFNLVVGHNHHHHPGNLLHKRGEREEIQDALAHRKEEAPTGMDYDDDDAVDRSHIICFLGIFG
jgi:hypothetical protein